MMNRNANSTHTLIATHALLFGSCIAMDQHGSIHHAS